MAKLKNKIVSKYTTKRKRKFVDGGPYTDVEKELYLNNNTTYQAQTPPTAMLQNQFDAQEQEKAKRMSAIYGNQVAKELDYLQDINKAEVERTTQEKEQRKLENEAEKQRIATSAATQGSKIGKDLLKNVGKGATAETVSNVGAYYSPTWASTTPAITAQSAGYAAPTIATEAVGTGSLTGSLVPGGVEVGQNLATTATGANTASTVASGAGKAASGASIGTAAAGIGFSLAGEAVKYGTKRSQEKEDIAAGYSDYRSDATYTNKEFAGQVIGSTLKGAGIGTGIGGALGGVGAPVGAILGAQAGLAYGLGKAIHEKRLTTAEQDRGVKLGNKRFGKKLLFGEENVYSTSKDPNEIAKKEYEKALKNQEELSAQLSNQFLSSRLQSDTNTGFNVAKYGGAIKKLKGGVAKPIGKGAVEYIGKKHEHGGIDLPGNIEVEGGETEQNNYIFSATLKLPNGATYAQAHKALVKSGASGEEIHQLALSQEAAAGRNPNEIKGMKFAKYGGPLQYDKGGRKERREARNEKKIIQELEKDFFQKDIDSQSFIIDSYLDEGSPNYRGEPTTEEEKIAFKYFNDLISSPTEKQKKELANQYLNLQNYYSNPDDYTYTYKDKQNFIMYTAKNPNSPNVDYYKYFNAVANAAKDQGILETPKPLSQDDINFYLKEKALKENTTKNSKNQKSTKLLPSNYFTSGQFAIDQKNVEPTIIKGRDLQYWQNLDCIRNPEACVNREKLQEKYGQDAYAVTAENYRLREKALSGDISPEWLETRKKEDYNNRYKQRFDSYRSDPYPYLGLYPKSQSYLEKPFTNEEIEYYKGNATSPDTPSYVTNEQIPETRQELNYGPMIKSKDITKLPIQQGQLVEYNLPTINSNTSVSNTPEVKKEEKKLDFDTKTKMRLHANEGVGEQGLTTPYVDSEGFWTVGRGHLLTDSKGKGLTKTQYPTIDSLPTEFKNFTTEQIEQIAEKDYENHKKIAQNWIGKEAWDKLPESVKSGTIELAYGVGSGGIKDFSNTRDFILAGDYESAAENITKSKYFKQVAARRGTQVASLIGGDDEVFNASASKDQYTVPKEKTTAYFTPGKQLTTKPITTAKPSAIGVNPMMGNQEVDLGEDTGNTSGLTEIIDRKGLRFESSNNPADEVNDLTAPTEIPKQTLKNSVDRNKLTFGSDNLENDIVTEVTDPKTGKKIQLNTGPRSSWDPSIVPDSNYNFGYSGGNRELSLPNPENKTKINTGDPYRALAYAAQFAQPAYALLNPYKSKYSETPVSINAPMTSAVPTIGTNINLSREDFNPIIAGINAQVEAGVQNARNIAGPGGIAAEIALRNKGMQAILDTKAKEADANKKLADAEKQLQLSASMKNQAAAQNAIQMQTQVAAQQAQLNAARNARMATAKEAANQERYTNTGQAIGYAGMGLGTMYRDQNQLDNQYKIALATDPTGSAARWLQANDPAAYQKYVEESTPKKFGGLKNSYVSRLGELSKRSLKAKI